MLDDDGNETGQFEVPAGGRRYRALELLVRQKRLAKDALIPCIVRTEGLAEEHRVASYAIRAEDEDPGSGCLLLCFKPCRIGLQRILHTDVAEVLMKRTMQREWMINILEASPSIVFTLLWRSGFDLQLAGWIAASLAAIQLLAFRRFRLRYDPIMLGINIHLLLITPFIMGSHWAGLTEFGSFVSAHSYNGVLVTVFVVGVFLTYFSKRSFVGVDLPQGRWIKQSWLLLAATGIAIIWSFANSGDVLVSVILPLIVLFGLRRLLVARTYDRNGSASGMGLVGAVYCTETVGGEDSAA